MRRMACLAVLARAHALRCARPPSARRSLALYRQRVGADDDQRRLVLAERSEFGEEPFGEADGHDDALDLPEDAATVARALEVLEPFVSEERMRPFRAVAAGAVCRGDAVGVCATSASQGRDWCKFGRNRASSEPRNSVRRRSFELIL